MMVGAEIFVITLGTPLILAVLWYFIPQEEGNCLAQHTFHL